MIEPRIPRSAAVSMLRVHRLAVALSFLVASLLGSCSLISSVIPCVERQHETGLLEVDRSFRQLQDIQHGVVPPKDLPDGDAIYTIHPDTRRNATVITIDRLSDPLLRALAARYGTAAIVIRIDPNRRWTGY